jgi:hypothetical protein
MPAAFTLSILLAQTAAAPPKPIEEARPVEAKVLDRDVEGGLETLAIEVPQRGCAGSPEIFLELPAGAPRPYSFADDRASRGQETRPLFVRRPAAAPTADKAFLYFAAADCEDHAGHRFTVALPAPAAKASSPKLRQQWMQALASRFERQRGPFARFAAIRVTALATGKPAKRAQALSAADRVRVLAPLYDTMTGRTSLQETLQNDRPLLMARGPGQPTIPIEQLAGPALEPHAFPAMLAQLGRAVPDEPLAAATPAAFYYVRFAGIPALLRALDEAHLFGGLMNELEGEDDDLPKRYETQLGLTRGPLTEKLGPLVIDAVALVGSDPYLREGSDVSVIFKVKQRSLFELALAAAQAPHVAAHGALAPATVTHHGLELRVLRSADGAVNQVRFGKGELEIVSNSLGAARRIADVLAGGAPALASEPDFGYMLARDAAGPPADVLAFLGDRFVAEVVGPRQKILEARRHLAFSDLAAPP